jgi:hypothetical protein
MWFPNAALSGVATYRVRWGKGAKMKSFRFAPIAAASVVAALLAVPVPAMATTNHPGANGDAAQSDVSCTKWTSGNRAYANCTVRSGKVRLRADCISWPDRYSSWKGKGTWSLSTGSCPLGIRGASIQTS